MGHASPTTCNLYLTDTKRHSCAWKVHTLWGEHPSSGLNMTQSVFTVVFGLTAGEGIQDKEWRMRLECTSNTMFIGIKVFAQGGFLVSCTSTQRNETKISILDFCSDIFPSTFRLFSVWVWTNGHWCFASWQNNKTFYFRRLLFLKALFLKSHSPMLGLQPSLR